MHGQSLRGRGRGALWCSLEMEMFRAISELKKLILFHRILFNRDPAMFKKNLTDLITGIRSHKANEGQYISQCIQEIKEELKSDSKSVKTIAVQKLTYVSTLIYECY
jgi:hypothetical protein